jgi:peptidoglycan/xylan/chitin deacetylase (PgdA/CDA1 family)
MSKLLADTLTDIALATAATGLAAGACAYAALWPTSQLFGATLAPGSDPNEIALTYDDGPSPAHTPALLDLLAAHNVHATFFLMGEHVLRHPQLARRIAEAGHTLGNHTHTHPNLALTSPKKARQELELCQQVIVETTGITPRLFRPPFGARRPDVLRTARSLGLIPVLWNVTAKDWDLSLSPAQILANIDRALQHNQRAGHGSNILLHDASHLDTVIDEAPRASTLAVTKTLLERSNFRFIAL